jgi:hypothetical protein
MSSKLIEAAKIADSTSVWTAAIEEIGRLADILCIPNSHGVLFRALPRLLTPAKLAAIFGYTHLQFVPSISAVNEEETAKLTADAASGCAIFGNQRWLWSRYAAWNCPLRS